MTSRAGRWTLYANTQGGWLIKTLLGAVFKTDPGKFRVITPDVGGGFGMKAFLYAEHVLTCYAAHKLGRPVKWASERGEAFVSDTHGRDNVTLGELAIDAGGKFLALRTRNLANMGAYLSTFAPYIPTLAGGAVLSGVYGFQQIYANVLGVFTHTVPVDAYRGAGRPESNYLLERLVDAAARELNIDRAELRRRNMVPSSAMPHATPVGKTYDSGDFAMVLDAALERMDYAGFAARRADAARQGKLRGIGFSYYLEVTMGDPTERAEIRFAEDGFVDVHVGTQSTGQGHETAYIQLTSQRLGIDGEKIRVRQGDTDTIPIGGGTGGSRSLYSEGQAILVTADTVISKGTQAAAEVLEAAPADIAYADGTVFDRRHRPRHRHLHACRDATAEGGGRRACDHARCRRDCQCRRAHLPERLPYGRSGSGSRDRRGGDHPLPRVRRLRQDREPDDRARPGAWRCRTGPRPSAAGAHELRRLGPASVRQLHGLRAAARRPICRTSRSICWKCQALPIRSA